MSQIDDFLSGKPAAQEQGASQIDAFLGDAPKRSLTRSVGDSAIALGTGVVQGVKMLADVAGADNAVSRGLGKASDALSDMESPYRKAQKQERAAKIKAAEDSGSTWEEVKAHAGAFADAPIDTTLNAIGTSVPTLATAAIPGLGQAALATRAAQAGVGIAQGVGGIKGQIHETVKQKLMGEGVSESEASQRADAAQAYGGGNMGSIALGGALGGLAGVTGAESAARRLLGRQLAGEVAERAAPGLVRSAVGGVLKEAPMEAVQGGQERLAGNLALQGEGFDVPTWQGVAGQAALEGLASAPMGGGFGLADGLRARAEAQARQQAEAEALRADPSRAWTTEAGAVDPNQPAGERAAPPEAPELTTSPGAGVARDGMDFTRDVDTSGLSLQDPAELERQRAATVDYQTGDTTPQWDTQPGAAPVRSGLDMPAPDFDTGALGFDTRPLSERMGLVPAANTPLTKAAALSVDTGASPVQFLGATGRDMQLRQTGPGVADESNVIDVQGRVVEDRAIGTPRRLIDAAQPGASQQPAGRQALPAPTNLREALDRIRQQRAEGERLASPSPAPGAAVPALGGPVGNDRAGSPANAVPDGLAARGEGNGGAAGTGRSLAALGAAQSGGRGNGNPALTTEAPNAQTATPSTSPRAQAVSAAGTAAVEAAGPATIPATTGATSVPQASQAQQGSTQSTQAGGPQVGAATATASTVPAGGNRVQAAGLTNGAPTQNPGAQAATAAGAQGQAPQTAVARPDGWRKSMLRAAPIARAMGIDPKGKRLAQVVAEIDARDTRAPATPIPAPAPAPGPVRIGRDQTPLSEGGKPFKTRKAAADAKRLQPMMRVVSVEGGYALAEKTPAQLAAEERASRRLRNPNTSAPGEPVAAHAFIAAAGGLNRAAAADLGVDGNPRIGNRTLFAGQGRGLSMDQATQMLIQDGYLSEGASINDALALIKTSLTRPQYNADGIERIAEAEAQAQFDDYLAAQEEAAADGDTDPFGMADEFTAEELDEVGYTDADPALQAEVNALIAQADAMGIDTYAILDDIARTYADATQDQYNAAARDALAQAIARGNQDGSGTAAQAAPAAEPTAEQGLTQPEAPAQQAQAATENVASAQPASIAGEALQISEWADRETAPIGAWVKADYKLADSQPIYQVRELPLDDLYLPETTKDGKLQPEKRSYVDGYADRLRAGEAAPGISVIEMEDGRMRVVDGHRRVMAARAAGRGAIRALVSPLIDTPGGKQEATSELLQAAQMPQALTSYTPADIEAQQARQERAAKAEAASKRAEAQAATAADDRKRIAAASVAAADSFELGQDPMDSLTGQGGLMFSRTGAKSPNAQQPTTRAWYDRFVSLLPESYRNDPHRREPLPAEDWNVQRAAEVREKIDALNKQLRGANDRKGYGPVSADGLGNLQVDARSVSAADLSDPIRALADELGAGVAATNVRSSDVRALLGEGFVSETSLAAIADRLMGRPFAQPVNTYTKDSAPGTILTYKPRGFPAALFARSATPPADSNERNVATQLLVDGLTKNWTRAPEIIVARNMQDPNVPQAVRDYDETLKSQGATGEARGFIYKGKVYLLSDELKGPQQIAEVLFHEVLGHYGLRGAFGDSLDTILQQIGTMRRRDVVAKAREYGLFDKDALGGMDKKTASDAQIWAAMSAKDRLSAAEEVLAEMAQTQPNIGFVQRAIAAIRNWLRSNVPGFKSLRLTDADIIQAYILPARGFVTRSKETGAQSLERAMMAFSRDTNEAMTNKDVVGNQGGRSADDTTPGTDENTGLPLNADGTVTVYHHTSAVGAEAIRKSGKLKAEAEPDVYVTTRRETDTGYGDTAVPIRVRPDQLSIDDEFPDGRKDFRLNVGKPGGSINVTVANESTAPDSGGAAFSRTATDQTQTEAFKKWFGDSKAVDAEGKPLLVYHGTSGNEGGDAFTYFDTYASNYGLMGQGAYFTDNPDVASSYTTKGKGDTPTVYKAFLSIQNPIDMDAKADSAKWQEQFDGIEEYHEGGGTNESWYRAAEDLLRDQALPMWEGAEAMQDGLRAMGHDGITHIGGGRVKPDGVRHRVYIAFEPTQVKSATGNSGAFDGTNPDIRFSRASTATGTQSAWDAPVQTGFDDVIYKLQDKNIDLKRVVEAIAKSAGQVADSVNAYLKEELFHKRAAKRVEDFGARELKPLMNKMRLAGLSMEDVEEYLHARHAKEANAVIAQRNPGNAGLQDGGSGMTNAAADNYFAKLDPVQRRKLEAVAKSVDAIIEGTRKLYVDYGLEDQAVVDGWASMYQHYIPLMREDKDGGMGTGQGFSVKGKETKGRTGSTRKVVDILANVAMQREKLIVRGEKNIVAQALVGLAQANPNPDFWEVRSQAPTERVFDPKTGVVVDRPDPLFKSRENVAVAKVKDANGKVTEQMVVFNEDNPRAVRMAAAMKNLDAGNLEGLLGVSAKITRYFAAINTQYNPVFGVVNLVRDVQGAMVNLGTTPLAGQQGKIAKDTLSALRGIYGDIRKTRKGGQATSQWSQLWEQMQDDGGTTGYRDLFKTSADRANDLKSILNPEGWMDSKWGKFFTADGRLKVPLSMAQKGATEIFGWLSDYNEAMENGVRLAAYKAALDKGMSREQAASLAKNLTVNFNRKGQAGMQAGAVYAFFNAAMQGTARIGQTLFDMDGGDLSTLRLSKTGKAVVYGGVMLGVMQALALSAAGFDDDDPPEFVRERSLIIPTGGKTYVSIPMPLGLHVIPGIGRHATEFALSGFDKPAKRAVSMVGMFADAFNPIGNAGLSMQTIAPTALDPLVALSENKDWTGKPIARVSSNKAMPGHTQWKDTATGFSKVVAEAINWISGGNEYVAGAFSPTPDQIDYLLAQVGGGVAREAAKVQQTISTAMSGETLPTHKIPLVGRFVGNAASQASQGSAFYANLNKLNELETEIKGLRKDGRFDEAAKLARENPQSIMIAMANRAERDVQRLRREKRELIANDASREQVRAKEDQITDVMTRLNEAVERRKAQAAR